MFKWLGDIPSDKALHFIAGMLVVAVIATAIPCVAPFAIVFGIIAGIAKEVRDEIVYGGFDWKDLVATVVGSLVAQIFVWMN